ncbi:MAG TPA: transglycosylase SLT domain-containing protein [Candidatus Tumulicola sp.]|jgi:hypothetical protein
MTIESTSSRLASEGVRYATQIAGAARKHGLNPELLAAVAAQETGGPGSNAGRNIVGDGGHGRGVFQIDDRWHDFAKTPEAMDPQDNADYAAGMISGLLKRYGGNVHEALSAYNAGDPDATGTRTQWGDGQNLGYADSVIEHYRRLTGTSGAAPPGTPGAGPDGPNDPSPQSPGINASGEPAGLAELLQALESMASSGTGSMQPPTPPQPPQSYHRQMTDYSSLFDDDDNG